MQFLKLSYLRPSTIGSAIRGKVLVYLITQVLYHRYPLYLKTLLSAAILANVHYYHDLNGFYTHWLSWVGYICKLSKGDYP